MIRWIDQNLGTAPYDQIEDCCNLYVLDVRDLVDKQGNSEEIIKEKVSNAIVQLNSGKKVVICCDYGISRSNALAAGVLALYKQISFERAVDFVKNVTREKNIKIDVLNIVRKSLGFENKSIGSKETRIMVTGGTGFIGLNVVPKLKNKYNVVTPSRQEVDLECDVIALDLYVKQNSITHILHLANPRIYTGNEAIGESLVILKNVLDVCKENSIKLIFLSSWEIYSGYSADQLIASEKLPPLPTGSYGLTKHFCELLIDNFQQNYGLETLIFRCSPVYGLGSDKPKFLYNFISKAIIGEEIVTHRYLNGFPKLDLLFIDDLTDLICLALEKDHQGIYNVGSGVAISTNIVAELIVNLINSKSNIRFNDISTYSPNIVMDCFRAKQVFGWEPKTMFQDGLRTILSNKYTGKGLI